MGIFTRRKINEWTHASRVDSRFKSGLTLQEWTHASKRGLTLQSKEKSIPATARLAGTGSPDLVKSWNSDRGSTRPTFQKPCQAVLLLPFFLVSPELARQFLLVPFVWCL